VCGFWLMRNNFRVFVAMFLVLLVRWRFGRYRPPYNVMKCRTQFKHYSFAIWSHGVSLIQNVFPYAHAWSISLHSHMWIAAMWNAQ